MNISLDKVWPSRCIFLAGEEDLVRRRALADLVQRATPDGDDFDLEFFDGESAYDLWIASACTAPFLAARRTVIVRHVLRAEPPDRNDLKSLPETALLILVGDDEVGDDQKQRKLASNREKWTKFVQAGGGIVEAFKQDAKAAPGLIRAEVKARGFEMSVTAANLFGEMAGGSLSRASEELDKLVLYAGDSKVIDERAIRQVVVPSREYNVFSLVESIVAGQVSQSLLQLRNLVGSTDKAQEAAHSGIIPLVHRHLRLIWQARAVFEAGNSIDKASQSFLAKPNYAKEPPYRQARLMQVARKLEFGAISRCMALVADADAKLKGMLPSHSAMETLEQLVLGMASVAEDAEANRAARTS